MANRFSGYRLLFPACKLVHPCCRPPFVRSIFAILSRPQISINFLGFFNLFLALFFVTLAHDSPIMCSLRCLYFAFLRESLPVHWKVPKTSYQSKTVVDREYERQSPLKKALCDRERIHVTGRIVYATLTCDSNRCKRDTADVTRFIYAHTWLTYKSSISARYWQSGGIRLFDSRTLTRDKWQRLITAAYSRPLAHRYPSLARLDRWEFWFAQSFQTNEQRANICSLIPRILPLCFDLFVQPFSRSIDLWLGG